MRHPTCVRTALGLLLLALAGDCAADQPLSRSFPLDFYRDVPSRNLKGLAARSDGRLVGGPVFSDLKGPAIGDLLWCLEASAGSSLLVGTGPDGKIAEVTLDLAKGSYTSREVVDLDEPQVFALKRLPDGSILAGTSPTGALVLIRDGKVVSRLALPVDSIFDLLLLPADNTKPKNQKADPGLVLAAAGNPGRIYRVDLAKFALAGINPEKLTASKALEEKGITLFGEIQDRNVRRLAALPPGQIVAGSSPKGNIYGFAVTGGDAVLLQENRDAEVAALLPRENGDLYAALVFTSTQNESRINRPAPPKPATETPAEPAPPPPPPPATQTERFAGRSALVFIPNNGFPETPVARANLAFYALAHRGDTIIVGGGEQGDLLGYDARTRHSLSFAGSASSQINQIAPLPGQAEKYIALRNNAPGLALIDFAANGPREAETRRLDLGAPSKLGALRFGSVRQVDPAQITVDVRTSWTSDEAEGWRPWQSAALREDGWIADATARYVKFRIKAASNAAANLVLDRGSVFFLPQNRRAQLNEFRVLSPNYALLPAAEASGNPTPISTLTQLLAAERERNPDDKRKGGLLGSGIAPQRGNQIIYWNLTDPDGDALAYTFSIRSAILDTWTDVAVSIRDSFVQFDVSHLEDGLYATRLSATELAPRPAGDRLIVSFETDDFVVDKTPPSIGEVKMTHEADALTVHVPARDATSLLEQAEFTFNNGYREVVTQPSDGIRDSRAETFALRAPHVKIVGATAVEIVVTDNLGNNAARRVELKKQP